MIYDICMIYVYKTAFHSNVSIILISTVTLFDALSRV